MHISRRAAAVGAAAVLTGLASLGAAGAAFASPAAPPAHATVQVLKLHTVFVSLAVNHAGHGGPGDVTAVVFDLQTPGGAEAGKAYVSCTAATASVSCATPPMCSTAARSTSRWRTRTPRPGMPSRSPAAPAPMRGSPARPAASIPDRGRATGRSI